MRSSGLVALLLIGCVIAHETCTTTTGNQGTCISIKQCQSLLSVLTGPKPLSTASLDLLRSSQCGFEAFTPRVCCELPIQNDFNVQQPMIDYSWAKLPSNVQDAQENVNNSPQDVSNHPNLRLLDHSTCGSFSQQKFFRSTKTGVFDFPWMALISYDVGQGKKEFRCGGSILNKRYILTAAHCVNLLSSQIELSGVRVGEHDFTTERDCDRDMDGLEFVCSERYQDFGIETSHFHPNYSHLRMQNDIALIRVNADIDFGLFGVNTICLPLGSAADKNYIKVDLAGWGVRQNNGPRYIELLQERLVPVPLSQCAETYRNLTKITYRQTCISARDGKDSCFGDSGGPMMEPVLYNNEPRYVQFGVESFGLSTCAIEGWPKVYTRVEYYLMWILDTIRE